MKTLETIKQGDLEGDLDILIIEDSPQTRDMGITRKYQSRTLLKDLLYFIGSRFFGYVRDNNYP
ncbi:MAG: hypothetical protein ABIB79_03505 [archaeon]